MPISLLLGYVPILLTTYELGFIINFLKSGTKFINGVMCFMGEKSVMCEAKGEWGNHTLFKVRSVK